MPLLQRPRDRQRVAQAGHHAKLGPAPAPERQREGCPRILPAPGRPGRRGAGQRVEQQVGLRCQRVQHAGIDARCIEDGRRRVPGTAQPVEQRIAQAHQIEVFVEAVRVVGLRGHQALRWAEAQARFGEQAGHHRRAGAVHPGDADAGVARRRLGAHRLRGHRRAPTAGRCPGPSRPETRDPARRRAARTCAPSRRPAWRGTR